MITTGDAFINKKKWALLVSYLTYLAVLAFAMYRHELWGDELHSWNISKASKSLADLIHNSRYEGHPPLWYSIMWVLSRFTHQLPYLQGVQFVIIAAAAYLALFRSPLPTRIKVLLPFGYYFLFEYGTLSRNYAIGLLLAFAICIILSRRAKPPLMLYYVLLFLLSNTHLLGVLLAWSLHLYFLLQQKERKQPIGILFIYAIAGILITLPALYFIKPPGDSSLNFNFWMNLWDGRQRLGVIAGAPAKSMVPMPAWWNYHFWNTHFLLEPGSFLRLRKLCLYGLSALLVLGICFTLRNNRKCLYLFLFNLALTCIISLMALLANPRYVGFIYIGFIVAAWLMYAEGPVTVSRKHLILLLILAQIPGGLFAVVRDIQYPFANGTKVNELIKEVPSGERVVTDYWCLNYVTAYTNKPAYCLDLNRELSFLQWEKNLYEAVISRKHYTNGATRLMRDEKLQRVYMISTNSWPVLMQKDTLLTKKYQVEMVNKKEGAIEKWGNLYLYRISARQ